MRLYISYAQSDAPYCMELVECLHGVHELWYDERRSVDAGWRQEIHRRVHWCDAFLYIVSAESLTSRYCQDELRLAKEANRIILSLQIETALSLPAEFDRHSVIDLSSGLDSSNQRSLLNTLLVTERQIQENSSYPIVTATNKNPPPNIPSGPQPLLQLGNRPDEVLQEGIKALNRGEYDSALYLLQQAQESGQVSPYVDISTLLAQTQANLQEDSSRRQAERLYQPIRELVRSAHNRDLGCQAFAAFQRDFPHYDPENLAAACAPSPLADLLWRNIPEGETVIQQMGRKIRYWNAAFRISQYPITHKQFQSFIEATDGYRSERWWQQSESARSWRQSHPQPAQARFPFENHPRENVSWFEAQAFSEWLSELLQLDVRLPSEQQWQHAAQGEDDRNYPWGNQFQARRCNCSEANHQQTTPVNAYPEGASPYGVNDMAGNVWEWCENESRPTTDDLLANTATSRIVRGGSFLSTAERLKISTFQTLMPGARAATVGFRVVASQI